MQGLEAQILFDMLVAYGRTAEQCLRLGRSDTHDAIAAYHCCREAHRDLYKTLREFTKKSRIQVSGLKVEADFEGGLMFRQWHTRPFNAEAQLCSRN